MTRIATIILPFILLTIFLNARQSTDPFELNTILTKLKAYIQLRPQQKIYLHLDKPIYASGEDIWFSAYMVDALHHRPDSLSKIIYVELFNDSYTLIQREILYAPNGVSNGSFHLPEDLPPGNFVIRAYTNYMKNADEEFFFRKEFSIINTSAVLPTKKEISTIDAQFFPEGGNFLTGVENRVAFKVLDNLGNSVSASGEILDENNEVVKTFSTEHEGMGVFSITPLFGKKYRARLTNYNLTFDLPEVMQNGFILRVVDAGENIKAIVYSNLKSIRDKPIPVSIVAQCRGDVRYAGAGRILNSSMTIKIPKRKLPSGITQITIFDEYGTPQCERLVFINHAETLNFSITPDNLKYGSRQKVNLNIKVTNPSGGATHGNFSMSIYDASIIKETNAFSNSISTSLLLTSDLKGTIADPGYYLKDTLTITKQHTDLLMMTHGWRRFTWKNILTDTLNTQKFYPENGIAISGTLLKSLSRQPSVNSTVKILIPQGDILILKTDSAGQFYSDRLLFYDSTELFIQTDNAKGKQTELKFLLDKIKPPPFIDYNFTQQNSEASQKFFQQTKTINEVLHARKGVTILKSVEVTAKKEDTNTSTKLYGTADATIKMKDVPQGYTNILQALQGRVAGVNVAGNPPQVSIRGGGEPLYLIDGMPTDFNFISSIPTSSVESIDVLKGANAAIYGMRGGNGVIAVYTKRGSSISTKPTYGIHTVKYPGLYKAREFYSPRYDVPPSDDQPDIRNTLYWNPTIKTDSLGEAHVSFYTSDALSTYTLVIEGISKEGVLGTKTSQLEVQ